MTETCQYQTVNFVPCPICAGTLKPGEICNGHPDSTLTPSGSFRVDAPRPLTLAVEKRVNNIAEGTCEQIVRAMLCGDKKSYLARWFTDRVTELCRIEISADVIAQHARDQAFDEAAKIADEWYPQAIEGEHNKLAQRIRARQTSNARVAQSEAHSTVAAAKDSQREREDAGSSPAPGASTDPMTDPRNPVSHIDWKKRCELAELVRDNQHSEIDRLLNDEANLRRELGHETLRANKLETSLRGARLQAQEDIAKFFEARAKFMPHEDFDDREAARYVRGMNLTPAAACDGLESERPISKAPAPPAEQSDRSLSDCPLCKLSVPEAREYARAAIELALADLEWLKHFGGPEWADKKTLARKRFETAKEALKNAPR